MLDLLIVGNPSPEHVGAHFLDAANELCLTARILDVQTASQAPFLLRQLSWRLRGHRPARLSSFSLMVEQECARYAPRLLLTTGIAPILPESLRRIAAAGTTVVNFLTDDPWNPAHRAPWFLDALPHYRTIYTPRQSTFADLRSAGCSRVHHLPFAYNPKLHYPLQPSEFNPAYAGRVLFAGGADPDRIRIITPLITAGFPVLLYGGYWDRLAETKPFHRGMLSSAELRIAIGSAALNLCLVRRANRDDHAMRSYEVPAIAGVFLAEQTPDHNTIYGSAMATNGFQTTDQLQALAREALLNPTAFQHSARQAHQRVTANLNTYLDRLQFILQAEQSDSLCL